jgi:O-antigen ligase
MKIPPGLRRIAQGAVLLLPPVLLMSRGVADGLMSVAGLLFLIRSALARDWRWTNAAWIRLAVPFWAWIALCSLLDGNPHSILQGALTIRFLIFTAALEAWVLADTEARRRLAWVIRLTAAWVVLECWQQYLTGANIFGYPRFGDGALTGPFLQPRAGGTYLQMFFPAVLPPAILLLARPDWRGRLGGVLLLMAAAMSMVLIGQRMPTLLMVLGLLIAALLLRRLRLPVLVALVAGALLLAATPVISPPTFAKLVVRFSDTMAHFGPSPYGQLFIRATAMLEAHPLFGLGFDGFRNACADPRNFTGLPWLGAQGADLGTSDGCNIHPHNYYLEIATTGGWPALLLFAALAITWLRRIGHALSPATQPMRAALFTTCAVALWPIASTSALFGVDVAGWVFLMLGWGLAAAACPGSSNSPGRSPP